MDAQSPTGRPSLGKPTTNETPDRSSSRSVAAPASISKASLRTSQNSKVPAVVVHGANALRDEMAQAMGVERRTVTSLKGYTSVFSDEKMLDMMMAAYAGVRNKRIVELCQRHGINAIGLTGLDGRVVQGRRNPGIRTMQDGKKVLLRDFSGKPQSVNVPLLASLMRQGYTPVLTAPIIDQDGVAINMENDDVVTVLARDTHARQIVSFIEARGLLANADDEDSLIARVDTRRSRNHRSHR